MAIDSVTVMSNSGVTQYTWDEMPESVKDDILLSLILKKAI